MIEVNIEEQAIQKHVFNSLRVHAPYLHENELERISAAVAKLFCAEWKRQTELIVRKFEQQMTGGFYG